MQQILVVDDEIGIRELLSEILSDEGYQVHLAENASAARAYRGQARPDLVLLDIQLPGRDGYALLQDLKALEGAHRWKVVALTAHAMPSDREKALAAGFDGYITKPIDIRTFPSEVAAYLPAGRGEPGGPAGAA